MIVSVIIPSRLQERGGGAPGELWLDRALTSVAGQGSPEGVEVVVGLDPGTNPPDRFGAIRFVHGREATQAHAVNAAVAAARGDVLAFLEDDDVWESGRLACGLPLLAEYDSASVSGSRAIPRV